MLRRDLVKARGFALAYHGVMGTSVSTAAMSCVAIRSGQVRVEDRPLPAALPHGSVLLGIECAGICRTDLQVADGRLAAADGVVLGHEAVGRALRAGPGVSGIRHGERYGIDPWLEVDPPVRIGVEVDGVFASHAVVPAAQLVPVDGSIRAERAAYLEPVAAALGVLDAPFTAGAISAILGDGRIAELTARLVEHAGFPAPRVVPAGAALERGSLDICVEAGLEARVLDRAIEALRPGGTLVLKSRGAPPVPLDGGRLVQKSLRILAPAHGSFTRAAELLGDDGLVLEDLFGETHRLADAAVAFRTARASEARKVFLSPG